MISPIVSKFGGFFPLPPGRRGIFQDAGDLRITEIQLQQRMHHPDRLRIAFKVTEILADHGVEYPDGASAAATESQLFSGRLHPEIYRACLVAGGKARRI